MQTSEIVETVLSFITSQGLREGDVLPAERRLAEALGLTRRELRQALSALEASGRVWRGVGRGTYLGSRPVKYSPSLKGLSVGTSPADVAEMRLMIEPALAALAASKASPEDLAEMEKCARKNAASTTDNEWQQWDHRFHLLIAQATRNPAIIALMEAVNGVRVKPSLRERTDDDTERKRFAAEHQSIVDAMRSRESDEAARRMHAHLANVQARIHPKAAS
jgi:GntR family transcriptional repressor for pyruvate dehydrogenase complex